MIVICCVDDAMGMLFNRRRQSRDRVVRAAIGTLAAGKTLWMNAYSAAQFSIGELPEGICVDEEFLAKAQPEDYCFVENTDMEPYENKISGLVLFHWNRAYPADVRFPLQLTRQWQLKSTQELTGYSHEKITMEVYER